MARPSTMRVRPTLRGTTGGPWTAGRRRTPAPTRTAERPAPAPAAVAAGREKTRAWTKLAPPVTTRAILGDRMAVARPRARARGAAPGCSFCWRRFFPDAVGVATSLLPDEEGFTPARRSNLG